MLMLIDEIPNTIGSMRVMQEKNIYQRMHALVARYGN